MRVHLPPNRQPPDRFRLRCGLLPVLAFILHALAMAGGMHAPSRSLASGLLPDDHAAIGDVIAADQEDVCWVVRPIVPRESDALALLTAVGTFLAFAHLFSAAAAFGALRGAEPTGSPGRRRALLQVYRL